MAEPITVSLLLDRTLALARKDALAAAVAVAVMVVPTVLVDITTGPDAGGFLAVYLPSLLGIFVQFVLTRVLLGRVGVLPAARTGSYVGALILTGLGIGLGFLLLIVPGLYLWASWLLVVPLILGEGMRAAEAISESGRRTRAHIGPIIGTLLVLNIWVLGALALTVFVYPADAPASLATAIAANLLLFVPQVLSWHCAVALHTLTGHPQEEELEQIFA